MNHFIMSQLIIAYKSDWIIRYLQIMYRDSASDRSEEDSLYNTPLSSELDLDSDRASFQHQGNEIHRQVQSLKNETMRHQQDVTQLLSKFMTDKIIVSKNVVPAELFHKKKELQQKIQGLKLRQAKLNQQAMSVDKENAKIEAVINSSQTTPDLIKKVEISSELQQKQQALKRNLDKHAKLQADLQIEIKLKELDNQLELKGRNDAQLRQFFTQKIEDEKEKIQKLRKKRMDLERRMHNENIMNGLQEQEGRKNKDAKLVEDRIRQLESNIERIRKNLESL